MSAEGLMNELRILAAGLNPVLQKTLVFEQFTPGKVNRAVSICLSAGGKGSHFARAADLLAPGCCRAAHFLGGSSGEFVYAQLEAQGIPQLKVAIERPTRTCTTVLCQAKNEMTELIEPSPEITAAEAHKMRLRLLETLPGLDGLALCGTFPPGIGPDLYAELARNKGKATLLLDAVRGVGETLATGNVDILKINLAEATALTGKDSPETAAAHCLDEFNVKWVALTDGPGRAYLFSPDAAWTYELPKLEKALNPLGAGDTASAVILVKLLEGIPCPEAVAWGLAAASASCLHLEGARFDLADMQAIHAQIVVRTL